MSRKRISGFARALSTMDVQRSHVINHHLIGRVRRNSNTAQRVSTWNFGMRVKPVVLLAVSLGIVVCTFALPLICIWHKLRRSTTKTAKDRSTSPSRVATTSTEREAAESDNSDMRKSRMDGG